MIDTCKCAEYARHCEEAQPTRQSMDRRAPLAMTAHGSSREIVCKSNLAWSLFHAARARTMNLDSNPKMRG